MEIRLSDHFDPKTLARGRDYATRGLVRSVDVAGDGALEARVANEQGETYRQRITVADRVVVGDCTCPVGFNCKHVAAALTAWGAKTPAPQPGLARAAQGWLQRVEESAARARREAAIAEVRPEGYPESVKDRLLYVLAPQLGRLRIEPYKGRENAAGTGLNSSIRRYDATAALRSVAPAKFIRPVDLDLLSALAQARLWEASYSYGLPDALRPRGADAVALLRRVAATGRLMHDAVPDAALVWSEDRPAPRLAWHMAEDGHQRLGFEDAGGRPLQVMALDDAAVWIDAGAGRIGATDGAVGEEAVRLVEAAPALAPDEAETLAGALPETLDGLALPRPKAMRSRTRAPRTRAARLVLSRETARDGPGYFGQTVQLPVLTLRFVYEGRAVGPMDGAPRLVDDGAVVTLERDAQWEAGCVLRLLKAGATPLDELDAYWPGARMQEADFVLEDDADGTAFAFQEVPRLRAEGWEVEETARWPYRLADEAAVLSVGTRGERGAGFGGNDWFSLGFTAEVGGKALDVAPLLAAFLEQIRDGWDSVPEVEALAAHLAARPVYLNRGKAGYVAIDLSPLAPLLHLFLAHHAEMGALHPSEAGAAARARDALEGSGVRFEDAAGILPLAQSLAALAETTTFEPPEGFAARLRDYQARGAAWMGSLLAAGFGGVLADDMGLGKTLQALALLLARKQAGAPGPALLVVPTSLLHGWQEQAARFAPGLRLTVLHGPGRAAMREEAEDADLVVTTYPLLARDLDWLAARPWPLVILDEAQTLKNPTSVTAKALRALDARGRIALTGTPLENSTQDLWTLMDWVNPGLLGDRKTFQTVFRTPIEKHGDAAAQARLNRRLSPFLLRRTKEAVAAELPPRTEILERVELPKPQQALYETVRAAMDARVRAAIDAKGLAGSRITVLDALLKLRQVCCDPALVKSDAARAVADSAKRARLRELLAELVAEGRRVLVFSQFVEMLRLIEADLSQASVPYLTLTGRTTDRGAVLDAFASGDAPVFLLSLKAGGVGLTLTEADTVILYDPWWNPAVERQAMDRAHRIGQTKPVFVHRLVAAGTVEERILAMQARKQALADALFEGEGQAAGLLDEATLRDLFAPIGG
jgi:hypothetical protein